MEVKTECECLRCGEDIAEAFRSDRSDRDVFVLTPVCAEWDANAAHIFPEPMVTRSHQMILCDDCMSKEYIYAKRSATAWPRTCDMCTEHFENSGSAFVRVTLTALRTTDPANHALIVEEAVPPHATTPDIYICVDCVEDHLGHTDTCFLLDIEPLDDDEEEAGA